jgi:hypothetical protein
MRPLHLLPLCALLLSALPAASAQAAPRADDEFCVFNLGFDAIHKQLPDIVGDCREDEHIDPATGNTVQLTKNGLLVWRKKDNVSLFTNGQLSWLRGPCGLQSRPNTDTFPWERGEEPACGGVYQGDPGAVNLTTEDIGPGWILSNQVLDGNIRVNRTPVATRHTVEFQLGFAAAGDFSPGASGFVSSAVTVYHEPALAEYVWGKATTLTEGHDPVGAPPPVGDSYWAEWRAVDQGPIGQFADLRYVSRVQNVLIEITISGAPGRVQMDHAAALAQSIVDRIMEAEKPPEEPEQPAPDETPTPRG